MFSLVDSMDQVLCSAILGAVGCIIYYIMYPPIHDKLHYLGLAYGAACIEVKLTHDEITQ